MTRQRGAPPKRVTVTACVTTDRPAREAARECQRVHAPSARRPSRCQSEAGNPAGLRAVVASVDTSARGALDRD